MDPRTMKLMGSLAVALGMLLPAGPAAAQAGKDGVHDSGTAAVFLVTIEEVGVATFFHLDFLSVSAEPAGDTQPRVTPVVQLRRGFTRNLDLWNWFQSAAGGRKPANAVLAILDRSGARVATYNLTNAWPSKIQIGSLSLKAGAAEVLIETVTIVCEDIQPALP